MPSEDLGSPTRYSFIRSAKSTTMLTIIVASATFLLGWISGRLWYRRQYFAALAAVMTPAQSISEAVDRGASYGETADGAVADAGQQSQARRTPT